MPGTAGQTVTYTRNPLGQVTRVQTFAGSGALVNATAHTYDPAHRPAGVTDSRGLKSLTYAWTPGGRLAQRTDGDGHRTSYAYDPVGRLATITAPNGEHIAFTYDAGGRLVEQRLHAGQRTTLSWYEDGSLKQRQNLFNTTVLSSHTYTLDPQGRRATQAENIGGTTKSWTYLYDHLDRLTSANDGSAETYSYDIFGNRRSKTKSGFTTAYLFDAAHQLAEIRSGSDSGPLIGAAIHDADGHLVKLCEGPSVTKTTSDCSATGTGATTLALAWNALDQLQTATRTGANALTESYQYDDQGRRIRKTSGTTTTHYLYDGEAIHAEWNGSIADNPTAAYVHGAGIDQPILRLTGQTNLPAATQSAYLQDGLGSVIATLSPTGTLTASQRFDAWGNRITGTGTIPQYGYTGREPDQTGLVYYRARYYHPGIARFTSRDPMGMVDAVSPYAYVANSPTNFVDPMGLEAWLTGTPTPPAYWGAEAWSSDWTKTGVRNAPGNQSLNTQTNNLASGIALAGTIAATEPTPIGELVVGSAIIGVGAYTLIDKMSDEINGITQRKDLGPQGEVYSLRATRSGEYPNVQGGTTYLNAGDVYKYGETTQPDERYPDKALKAAGLEYQTEFQGSQMMSKIVEKQRIYGHFFETGSLPPGNKIFR